MYSANNVFQAGQATQQMPRIPVGDPLLTGGSPLELQTLGYRQADPIRQMPQQDPRQTGWQRRGFEMPPGLQRLLANLGGPFGQGYQGQNPWVRAQAGTAGQQMQMPQQGNWGGPTQAPMTQPLLPQARPMLSMPSPQMQMPQAQFRPPVGQVPVTQAPTDLRSINQALGAQGVTLPQLNQQLQGMSLPQVNQLMAGGGLLSTIGQRRV